MKIEKRDKKKEFIKLANKRVNKGIKLIQLIGNLSSKANYDYDEKQSAKIISALEFEIKTIKERFKRAKSKGGDNNFEI